MADRDDYEKRHIERLRVLAPECMVLLRSDGSFPLETPGKLALYGSGARYTLKGGTGSGDVNVRHFATVEEGLVNAGFTITTRSWLDGYDTLREKAQGEFYADLKRQIAERGVTAILEAIGAVMPEPEYELPLEGEGDVAVYVLARISGEGSDRRDVPGDFRLSDTEIRDIRRLQRQYPRFLLALNVGGVVDLSPVVGQVSNILLLSQTGMTIGDSFADVLLGKSCPSGKLASTWAGLEDYCHAGDFGQQDDTRYREGIYVGYRYFDSIGKAPQFPFGYGLGYTDFDIKPGGFQLDGSKVTVTAYVRNIGSFPGKEVAQLYVSVPCGKLDQPYQTLAAFEKTRELKAGEGQTLQIAFDMERLASFDMEAACDILEAGDYVLRLGNSSRHTKVCGVVRLEEAFVVQRLSHAGGTPDFEDWRPGHAVTSGFTDWEQKKVSVKTLRKITERRIRAPKIDPEAMRLAEGLTDSELAYLCVGGFADDGSKSFIGNAGMQVAGAAGETAGLFRDRGLLPAIMADGPAGLRLSRQYGVDEKGTYTVSDGSDSLIRDMLPEPVLKALHLEVQPERNGTIHEQNCSAIPIGTALAQSWNRELCRECGDMVGEEMERFGVHLWLAPALNIHRWPLCGRNFEYYSEDPFVSGEMAAAITMGVQRHPRCGVTVKHFVCNNQETNRFHSNSIVSERALRDIYMKGFQIAIQKAQPTALMTSYNLLNGEHTSQREDILETVLRQEWGYEGIIMSDWVTPSSVPDTAYRYPSACASGSIRAGNDLMMPGGRWDHENLLTALSGGRYAITRKNLEKCAARVIALTQRLTTAEGRRTEW